MGAKMQTTMISFSSLGEHGDLFADLLRARKKAFVDGQNWDLPTSDGMEYDQYDTPASRWIAVHDRGKIMAGIRLTPTTARCGEYSYMIRDAQLGLLPSIPRQLLFAEAPVDSTIWESSRIFVDPDVPASERSKVHLDLMNEMIIQARKLGAKEVLGLVPAIWKRWTKRINIQASAGGPIMIIDGMRTQVASMDTTKAYIN